MTGGLSECGDDARSVPWPVGTTGDPDQRAGPGPPQMVQRPGVECAGDAADETARHRGVHEQASPVGVPQCCRIVDPLGGV